MGRKGIYTEELQTIICDAIAAEGTDQAGFTAGGIGEKTFYTWLNKNEQFRQAVARARTTFSETCPPKMKVLAKQRMMELLEQGQVIKWERTRALTQEGDVRIRVTETTVNIERRPTPAWVLNKILPNPIADINQAIAMVTAAGYLVIDPTIPPEREQASQGLTDEAANTIKSKLLGITTDETEYQELDSVYS